MAEEIDKAEGTDDVTQLPAYLMPGWLYQALKWVTLVGLPLAATGYTMMAGIWGLPLAEQVSQTCNALALVLGVSIGVSALTPKVRG